MPITRESKLEKYIVDFVYARTGERVELKLKDDIFVSPVSRRGSTILGILWANVLQHDRNFPKHSNKYYKEFDDKNEEEKLMLTFSHVTFAVYLKSGTLRIKSDYVYEWFAKHFQDLLILYDSVFASSWVYSPTQFLHENKSEVAEQTTDLTTSTEAYLLFCNTSHSKDAEYETKLHDGIDGLIVGVGDLSVHKELFKGDELQSKLEDLKSGGLYDTFHFLYKLYMSLLYKWFNQDNTKIFISSPQVDAKILKEVIDLFLSVSTAPKGILEAFYLEFNCDVANTAIQIKKDAISSYTDRLRAYIEYHILRKMIHVSAKVNGTFMAAVCDGKAEVLVATAHLHSNNLYQQRLETAIFLTIDENQFMRKYIEPCATPNASVAY